MFRISDRPETRPSGSRTLLALVGLSLVAAAPPTAQLGPDERRDTKPIEAPIDEVIVFSNRARVVRRARIELQEGAQVFRFEPLPAGLLEDSVRVSAAGARVMRAEIGIRSTESFAVPSVAEQLETLERLRDERSALADRSEQERRELDLIRTLQPTPFVEEAQRDGRALPPIGVGSWLQTADFLADRADAARRNLRTLEAQLRPLDERIAAIANSLNELRLSGDMRRVSMVYAVVHSPRPQRSELTISYEVDGPTWSPVYDLHYAPEDGQLKVFTGAIVRQRTGEDWTRARLIFSTGVPDDDIALPLLKTWTLGEQSDFLPEVRPVGPVAAPRFNPPPEPIDDRPSEALIALRERWSAALGRVKSKPKAKKVGEDESVPDQRPRAPPPAAARGDKAVEMEDSMEVAEVLGAAQILRSEAPRRPRRERRPAPTLERRAFVLAQTVAPNPLHELGSETPAKMVAGIEYLYPAPARTDVKSDGMPLKVPVAVERFATEGYYEVTPGLDPPTAYLKARLTNRSTRPMLAGPTHIFVNNQFLGQGQIVTVAPEKQISFGLGADESIKVKRTVRPTTREEGVFSKDAITRYHIEIQVANYHQRGVKVEVLEPIPQSLKDDIGIRVLSLKPKPLVGPMDSNVARFGLEVPPGETKTVELTYEIERPADFVLEQR